MEKFYTAGQLAKLAGVSSRTIRFYDEKGILEPAAYSESDYRLYEEKDLLILQEILMLKYIGLPLEEIRDLLKEKEGKSLEETLNHQKNLLLEKRKQLDRILYAVDTAREHCAKGSWELEDFTGIMQLITNNEKYNRRYYFYEKYGTRQREWFDWRFDRMELKPESRILDVGCGHGMVWRKNWEKIPKGCSIMALDKAKEPLEFLQEVCEKQKKYLAETNINFHFLQADAEKADYQDMHFDCIVANHFWNYIEDKENLMEKFADTLEQNGIMVSTISTSVFVEDVKALVRPFLMGKCLKDYEKTKQEEKRNLEKGFGNYFSYVDTLSFKQELMIDRAEDVYAYLCQLDKELEENLSGKRRSFLKFLEEKLVKEQVIKLRTENIMFVCRK